LDRDALLDDVMAGTHDLDGERLVQTALPIVLRRSKLTPVFKYLRQAGLLEDDGSLIAGAVVAPEIATRVTDHAKLIAPVPRSYADKGDRLADEVGDFGVLVEAETEAPWHVLMYVTRLAASGQDAGALRDFLVSHRTEYFENGNATRRTHWIKAVLLYDWLVYGPKPTRSKTKIRTRSSGPRAGSASPRRARPKKEPD
jgi:hypothetical protein